MPHARSIRPHTLLSLAACAGLTLVACASLGTPEEQAAAAGLYGELDGYRSWGHFEGHAGVVRGTRAHGRYVQTFVNGVGAANASAPAYGTIIVKENYGSEDPSSLASLTVMQRVEGFDAENGDWFWARYTADGELTHSGQVAMCADCHFDAGGDDFVFLND